MMMMIDRSDGHFAHVLFVINDQSRSIVSFVNVAVFMFTWEKKNETEVDKLRHIDTNFNDHTSLSFRSYT